MKIYFINVYLWTLSHDNFVIMASLLLAKNAEVPHPLQHQSHFCFRNKVLIIHAIFLDILWTIYLNKKSNNHPHTYTQ